MIELNDCAVIPAHVIVRGVANETVLLNLNTEHYYSLNSVATSMVRHATTCPSLNAALTLLSEEYEVEYEQLLRDFAALMNELVQAGLIELVPPNRLSDSATTRTEDRHTR